jgi:hypothetical protein
VCQFGAVLFVLLNSKVEEDLERHLDRLWEDLRKSRHTVWMRMKLPTDCKKCNFFFLVLLLFSSFLQVHRKLGFFHIVAGSEGPLQAHGDGGVCGCVP